MTVSSETVHASTVAIAGRAVMLTGPSGIGKSDLALRLVDRGAVLVSDDYTVVTRTQDRLLANAPDTIRNRMEVRGIGIVEMHGESNVPVSLCVELCRVVERMPPQAMLRNFAGIDIPVTRLVALESSAAIKVELALAKFGLVTG